MSETIWSGERKVAENRSDVKYNKALLQYNDEALEGM